MFRIVHKVSGYYPSAKKKREENILTASAQVLIWVQRIINSLWIIPLLFLNKKEKLRN